MCICVQKSWFWYVGVQLQFVYVPQISVVSARCYPYSTKTLPYLFPDSANNWEASITKTRCCVPISVSMAWVAPTRGLETAFSVSGNPICIRTLHQRFQKGASGTYITLGGTTYARQQSPSGFDRLSSTAFGMIWWFAGGESWRWFQRISPVLCSVRSDTSYGLLLRGEGDLLNSVWKWYDCRGSNMIVPRRCTYLGSARQWLRTTIMRLVNDYCVAN